MSEELNISYKRSGNYNVVISDSLDAFKDCFEEIFKGQNIKVLIISDTNVAPLYMESVKSMLLGISDMVCEYIIEAGEKSKNSDNALLCLKYLKEHDFHRSDVIIALGGGVVGDLSGYVASVYMRGIKYVQLPTSLLAMADSSIGGKCAIDLDGFKNMIGSVYMPLLVYENLAFLNTLNEREYACGMAEILKAGLIKNGSFYEWLIMNFDRINDKESEALTFMLNEACKIKKKVVEEDPYEEGERMLLNFGHTVGHAIEKCSDFNYNHGESVALGMIAAAYISWKRNLLSMEEFYEIRDMFVPFNLPISVDKLNTDLILNAITYDKKQVNGSLNFILLKKIGKAVIVKDISEDEIKEAAANLVVEWD